MKIVRYKNSSDVDVEFIDEYHYVKQGCAYENFKRGVVSNPYDKVVYGIGYLGNGKYNTGTAEEHTLSYMTWFGMIRRCYSKKKKEKFPAYFGTCTVCDEWHNYQNFAKWFEENYIEVEGGLHIDKDILFPGNKEYSPEKCLLVPQRINMLFVNHPHSNKNGLPTGIHIIKNGKLVAEYNAKRLGIYSSLDEAFASYKDAKERAIKTIAEEYKSVITRKLYEALINYEVLLKNDINYIA